MHATVTYPKQWHINPITTITFETITMMKLANPQQQHPPKKNPQPTNPQQQHPTSNLNHKPLLPSKQLKLKKVVKVVDQWERQELEFFFIVLGGERDSLVM